MEKPPLPSRLNTYTSAKGASQPAKQTEVGWKTGYDKIGTIGYDPIGGSFDFSNFNFYLNAFDLERVRYIDHISNLSLSLSLSFVIWFLNPISNQPIQKTDRFEIYGVVG